MALWFTLDTEQGTAREVLHSGLGPLQAFQLVDPSVEASSEAAALPSQPAPPGARKRSAPKPQREGAVAATDGDPAIPVQAPKQQCKRAAVSPPEPAALSPPPSNEGANDGADEGLHEGTRPRRAAARKAISAMVVSHSSGSDFDSSADELDDEPMRRRGRMGKAAARGAPGAARKAVGGGKSKKRSPASFDEDDEQYVDSADEGADGATGAGARNEASASRKYVPCGYPGGYCAPRGCAGTGVGGSRYRWAACIDRYALEVTL